MPNIQRLGETFIQFFTCVGEEGGGRGKGSINESKFTKFNLKAKRKEGRN